MGTQQSAILNYMVDTNVFNWLVQGYLAIDDLPSDGDFFATPVQRAELEATRDDAKRGALLANFSEVVTGLYSAPFTFDVPGAGFDQGRMTDGILASAIRSDLDGERKKRNNIQDALIAETAITTGFTLVTCDRTLRNVAQAHGCTVLFFERGTNVNRHPES
jgi:predicted nucleic acid-binding protein